MLEFAHRARQSVGWAHTESWVRSARKLHQDRDCLLTWHHVPGIHGVLVLDESETVHELDLGYFTGSMGGEVLFNIGLGSYRRESSQRRQRFQD